MGFVYLLGEFTDDGSRCKIGVTRGSVEKRLKKLQTGNPNEIYVIAQYETEYPFEIENLMHMKYFGRKVKNEWFELTNIDKGKFLEDCQNFEKNLQLVRYKQPTNELR